VCAAGGLTVEPGGPRPTLEGRDRTAESNTVFARPTSMVRCQRGLLELRGHTLRCAAGNAQDLANGRRLGVDVGLAVPREARSQGPLHVGKVTCGLAVGA